MPRKLRPAFTDAMYHVTTRGNHKCLIYLRDRDRHRFLDILEAAVKRYDLQVITYCLMSNHYHLQVVTPKGNIADGMRYVNGVYAQWFNREYELAGHLFERRYRATVIKHEEIALDTARYIILNPVRAGLAARPEAWRWSSYRMNIGYAEPIDLLDNRWLPRQFPSLPDLRRFVDAEVHPILAPGLTAPNMTIT